jgi:hypothetical protein
MNNIFKSRKFRLAGLTIVLTSMISVLTKEQLQIKTIGVVD